ncbi:MAG: T9SS type A sorting domain-containing protein [Bacteroidota bacterium]
MEAELTLAGFETQKVKLSPREPMTVILKRLADLLSHDDGLTDRKFRTESESMMFTDEALSEEIVVSGMAATPADVSSVSKSAPGAMSISGSRSESTFYAVDGISTESPSPTMTREDAFMRGMSDGEATIVDDFRGAVELPKAGQLTAGEANDLGKWELWKDVSLEDLYTHRETWGIYPDHRYGAQIRFANGSPAIDVEVFLQTSAGRSLWRTRTDRLGRAELWRSIFDQQDIAQQERLRLVAIHNGKEYRFETAHAISEGYNSLVIDAPCDKPMGVDVAFVIDATGSMGDELSYLSSELLDVMKRATDSLSGDDLRLGAVVYRDRGDDYLTRHSDLTDDLATSVDFIKAQSAGGGGDTPEAVEEGLATALESFSWREDAVARLLFLVLDAPPHVEVENLARLRQMTSAAARRGIRIIPVVCSGMQPDGEYLMRSMALATNGTYTFLTDHSGIGNPHLEPSTDSYEVEKLNELLLRLIIQFGKSDECGRDIVLDTSVDPTDDSELNWTVYPNPTFGPISINFDSPTGTLTVVDELGKALRQYAVNADKLEFNLSDLAAGLYLLRYENEEGEVETQRLVLQYAR